MGVLSIQNPMLLNALGADKLIDDGAGNMYVFQKDNSVKTETEYIETFLLPDGIRTSNYFEFLGVELKNTTVVKVGNETLTNDSFEETTSYNILSLTGAEIGGTIKDFKNGTFQYTFSYSRTESNKPVIIIFGEIPLENRPIWQIKKIEETEVSGVKTTKILFPNGLKNYKFVASNYSYYNYKYSI